MTYLDVKELVEKEYLPVIPIGSLEIHGPHLPLGIDGIVAHRLALEAARYEKIVVLPPIYYSYVPEHRHFPGTISLKASTFMKLLGELCDELQRMGFRKIVLLNGHGGNIAPLRTFLRERLWRRGACVYAILAPWNLASDVIEELREGRVYGHACEIETSIALHVAPELVRRERIPLGEIPTGPRHVVNGVETPVDWVVYAVEGAVGSPSLASQDKGRKIFEKIVERLVEIFRKIREDKLCEEGLAKYSNLATCSYQEDPA